MYLSDLIGSRITDHAGRRFGRVRDVIARVGGAEPARVIGVLTRQRSRDLFIPIDAIARLNPGTTSLQPMPAAPRRFTRRDSEVLLGRDVMDSQVIDVHRTRLVRVADVIVEQSDDVWQVHGIITGIRVVLRRLWPRAWRRSPRQGRLLAWDKLELLACEIPGGGLRPDHTRLAQLHPADIARVADAVPARQATEIVASLDDALAANTMEEMIDAKQADVIEALDPDRAADILEQMAPDAAADVLAEMEPDVVNEVLKRMSPTEAGDVHALLTYPKDTAGGLMTTDVVIAPRDLRVGEATAYLRPLLEKPDWVYYVYVVDDLRERRLAGVFSLRDLLLAAPDRRIDEIMTTAPRRVQPDAPASTVARIMSEYNLMAMPVTDEKDRLLGIVGVDDALETILPEELKRRLPRVFS